MESNTKNSNKESLKKAQQRSNNRKKETTDEANNRNKIIAQKRQKSKNWRLQNKQIFSRASSGVPHDEASSPYLHVGNIILY